MKNNRKFGMMSILLALFMIAIIIAVNFGAELLSERYPLKADISQNQYYALSEYTKNVLADLDKDVHVYALYNAGDEDIIFTETLERYQRESDRVTVEFVGEKEMPELSYKYDKGNQGLVSGTFIFVCGEKYRIVTEDELSNYNLYTGTETEVYAEERFTQAILEITSDKEKNVYVVAGHGEDDGELDGILAGYGYNKKEISLVKDEIPADCTILIIRKPISDFSDAEILSMDDYLYNGGRLLVLLDPSSFGLNNLYAYLTSRWGVFVTDDAVMEGNPDRILNGTQFFYASGAGHEIGENLLDVNDANGFVLATFGKPVEPINGSGARSIMRTTEEGYRIPFAVMDGEALLDSELPIGQASIAATAEMGEGKIAVFGSAYYFTDEIFNDRNYVNKELFLNTLEWLHKSEINTGIRPKSLASEQLQITESQQIFVTIIIFLFPILILAYGIFTWIRRVHK